MRWARDLVGVTEVGKCGYMGFLLLYGMLIWLGLWYHFVCFVEIICTNIYLSYTYTVCNTIQKYGFCSYSCRFINLFKLLLYRVIHKSVKHVRKLIPQLNEDSNDYIFQQDGSPAHYKDVRGYLNRNLPQRWIGRTGKEDDALLRWSPPSPDLTPCDFLFWGFVKDSVFVPPLPANL